METASSPVQAAVPTRLLRTLVFLAQVAAFGLLPALLVAGGLLHAARTDGALFDLGLVLTASDELLAGRSPYPLPELVGGEGAYLYPPVLAWALAPLAVLPASTGQVVYFAIAAACVPAALALLGVRDWRCYGAALLGGPVLYALHIGTAGPLLLLGIAAAWRLRSRPFAAAAVVGVSVALKPFVWPMLLWPAVRRRPAASFVAVALTAVVCLAAWAAIGFAGLSDYPRLVREAAAYWGPKSYSLAALVASLGVPFAVAGLIALAAGLGLLGAARSRRVSSEAVVFTLCLAAGLVATPIAWEHYLVLVLVPIALASPRLSLLWLAPIAVQLLSLPAWSDGRTRFIVSYWVAAAAMLGWSIAAMTRPSRAGRRAGSTARSRIRSAGRTWRRREHLGRYP